jgi:hypothetical protein
VRPGAAGWGPAYSGDTNPFSAFAITRASSSIVFWPNRVLVRDSPTERRRRTLASQDPPSPAAIRGAVDEPALPDNSTSPPESDNDARTAEV